MSTMYYTVEDKRKRPIGMVTNAGMGKYNFTWCMFPLEFALFHHDDRTLDKHAPFVIDEYGEYMLLYDFEAMVNNAELQSFDEEII